MNSYIKEIKCEAIQLKHSKTAAGFHVVAVAYMTEIVDGYGVLLIKYIDEQKKEGRKVFGGRLLIKTRKLVL